MQAVPWPNLVLLVIKVVKTCAALIKVFACLLVSMLAQQQHMPCQTPVLLAGTTGAVYVIV